MKQKILSKENRYILLFAALTLLVTAFIFSNSLRSHVESDEQSKTVAVVIDPTIDPQGGVDDYEWLNVIVRKAAHGAEFALLGAVAYGLIFAIRSQYGKWLIGYLMFAVLAIAVTDEALQYLVPGRSPQVSDILIDFGGALFGITFGGAAAFSCQKWKGKASKRK